MDSLLITGLCLNTHIGIHAWEQKIKQKLLIDINIPGDFSNCEDNIDNTIDYDALCKAITGHVEGKAFKLIETVANEVADLIKKEFGVNELRVAVAKPNAIANAASVQVVVTR